MKYVAPESVDLNLVLANGETAEISVVDGSSATVKGDGTPAGKVTTLSVPGQKYSFTLNIKLTGNNPVDLAAVTVGGGWTAGAPVMNNTNSAGTEKTYTVLVSRSALPSALLSASFVPAAEADLRVYSAAGAQALAAWVNTSANLTGLTDAELVALREVLTDLHTALPAGDLKDSVNTAKTAVDAKVEEIEEEAAAALAAAKEGLEAKITALIDGQESEAITAAKSALTGAIDACETVEEVQAYYKDGALVVTNEKVAALAEAVQAAKDAAAEANKPLTDAKAAALAAVDAMVGNKTSAAITNAKKALVDAINACTTLTADGTVASSKVLATYWDATADPAALVAENALVSALQDALDDADASVALSTAKLDAIEAVDAAIGAWESDAITTARANYVTAINGCETVEGSGDKALATYWTAENGLEAGDLKTALETAITEAKKVTATISDVSDATVKETSGVVAGTGEAAGKYTVTIAQAGDSTNVTFNIADDKFVEDSDGQSPNNGKFVATVTFTVTGGTASTEESGATITGTGTFTLTVVKDAAPSTSSAGTDVVVAITAPAAQA